MTAIATPPAAPDRARQRGPVAADGLLAPLPIAGIALLLLNDHLLKDAWPGLVTGKLSDFAGLLFFPLFLQAIAEVLPGKLRAPVASRRVVIAAVVATAAVFSAVEVLPAAAHAYEAGLGILQWPFASATAVLSGGVTPLGPAAVRATQDPSDLVALLALWPALVVGARRSRDAAGG